MLNIALYTAIIYAQQIDNMLDDAKNIGRSIHVIS